MYEELFFKICAQESPCNYFLFRNFFVQYQFPGIYFASCTSEILMTESKRLMDFNSWKRDLIQRNQLNVLWKDEFFGMTSA